MRLSIWQQFSSNHSAEFELVGVFRSPEEAAKAGHELSEMLRAIHKWFVEHRDSLTPEEAGLPSPVEREYADRWNIKWNDCTLMQWVWMEFEGDNPVEVADNLLFINGPNSWIGAKPLDDIVRRLGGEAYVDGTREVVKLPNAPRYPYQDEVESQLTFTLVCQMPDEAAAESLVRMLHKAVAEQLAELLREKHPVEVENGPFELDFETGDVTISSVSRSGQEVSLIDAKMRKLYHFPRLLDYLEGQGVSGFKCTFTERTIGGTTIKRATKPEK